MLLASTLAPSGNIMVALTAWLATPAPRFTRTDLPCTLRCWFRQLATFLKRKSARQSVPPRTLTNCEKLRPPVRVFCSQACSS